MRFIQGDADLAIQGLELASSTRFQLVIADPPYGNIVRKSWDHITDGTSHAHTMTRTTKILETICLPGAALYWWGGIGKPLCRPFFQFLVEVEEQTNWRMAALITWKKKRAYGVRNNYLFTREECAYFVLGDPKKPRVFNKPYLNKLRGYAGYDPDHPALDARLRRTMVWDDVTEVLRGKKHECEKPAALSRIMIETSSNPGDHVLDLYCGCGNAGRESERLGRHATAIDIEPLEGNQ